MAVLATWFIRERSREVATNDVDAYFVCKPPPFPGMRWGNRSNPSIVLVVVMDVVVDNEYLRIEEHTSQRVVVLQRKASAGTVAAIGAAYAEVQALLRPEFLEYGLIIDTREAPGRNDSEFEAMASRMRAGVEHRFARVVTLVGSAIGELQVRRMAKAGGFEVLVTRDRAEAMTMAAG